MFLLCAIQNKVEGGYPGDFKDFLIMTNKSQCRGSDNDDQRHWLIIWIGADELLKRLPVGGGGVDGGGGDTIGVSRNIQIRISKKKRRIATKMSRAVVVPFCPMPAVSLSGKMGTAIPIFALCVCSIERGKNKGSL